MAQRKTPKARSNREPVNPASVSLKAGKGSSGRGGGPGGGYWHIVVDGARAGHVYVNVIDEPPVGSHASIQIQVNQNMQGRGVGSVAYRLAVEASEHDVVYAHMRKSNLASRRSAEKAGFVMFENPEVAQLLMVWRRRGPV